jgi:hypothetical protein
VPCLPCDLQWNEEFFPSSPLTDGQKHEADHRNSDSAQAEHPDEYVLNTEFDRDELRRELDVFESSVKRQKDLSLARKLRTELLESVVPHAPLTLMKQLGKWCMTDGPLYSQGMEPARRISRLLFHTVIDRSHFGV